MQTSWFHAVDAYTYRARLLPALLTLLPVFVTVMILYPAVYNATGAAVASLAVGCGVLAFLTHIARTRGRSAEERLIRAWGGQPSTCMLRHGDASLDPHTKGRYHSFLAARVPGLRMPGPETERSDPAAADAVYRSGVSWLLEFARDKSRYPLVYAENVSYGFRRNLYGLKPIGLGLCVACAALTADFVAELRPRVVEQVPGPVLLLCGLLIAAFACWTFFVTPASVLDASRAYARALLATCDASSVMDTPPSNTGKIHAP
jgi:hypothetical protein